MSTLQERFQKGLEMRERLGGGEGRLFRGSVSSAYELAPDMYRITTESLYGSIWSRPGLDFKHRVMVTNASAVKLATTGPRAHTQRPECGRHAGGDHRDPHDDCLLRRHSGVV